MTRGRFGTLPDPDALRRRVRDGDDAAIDELVAFLGAYHPYTHANAAVILAESIGAGLAGLVDRLVALPGAFGPGHAILLAELEAFGRVGTDPRWAVLAERLAKGDPEVLSLAWDFVARFPGCVTPSALAAWAVGDDERLAWQAAETLARTAPLTPEMVARLVRVRGPVRAAVHLFLAEQRAADALPGLYALVNEGGPFAWLACDAIESLRPAALPASLVRRANRRWFVDDVAVRLAATLSALNHPEALAWLRRYADHRSERIRLVARVELARVGTEAEASAAGASLDQGPEAAAIQLVLRLPAMTHRSQAESWLRKATESPSSAVREAAARALGDWPDRAWATPALEALARDADDDVREAATLALAPPSSPWAGRQSR